MNGLASSGPVWYAMRASGVVALVLLTLTTELGVASVRRVRLAGLPGFATPALHRSLSLLSVSFLAVHVLTAIVDPDAAVGLAAVVLPLGGSGQTLWLGLGALSLDLLAAVVLTSLVRRRLGLRLWRAVHLLAYASFPLALAHSVGLGTDAGEPWLQAIAAACAALVGAALAWRLAAPPARAGDVPTSATRHARSTT
jgi:sulfoxide reductase heme-binding subunit YedZ